jgi:hypothetical protein
MNGLKVLVKRREGSQTVAIQLYIRGGAAPLPTPALKLSVNGPAKPARIPRDRMRKELARMGHSPAKAHCDYWRWQ